MKEVFDKCYSCHSPLKLKISETVVCGAPDHEYVINHEPCLACTKCTYCFQAESYQYEKNAFIGFLKSIPLKKAEIEYKDMIQYVDDVLKFKGDK